MESLSVEEVVQRFSSPEYNQAHLFPEGQTPEQRASVVDQLKHYDRTYPGGVLNYINNARRLLADSANDVNPFEGYRPQVPAGETVSLENNLEAFLELERIGLEEVGQTAFVLVAGGLGERLGYSSIKIEIPIELVTGTCFIQYYIKNLLALQQRTNTILPLAIMTSEDTNAKTVQLLEENAYFGFPREQVTIMKQEMVPALIDNEARLVLEGGRVVGKPHGHGDVHTLLYQHGLPQQWLAQGKKWLLFFQDTNALIFRCLLPFIGVSKRNNFEMNFMTVDRQPKEAMGGIMRLVNNEGQETTLNVEYNQIDALLRASNWHPEGDVNNQTLGLAGNPIFSPFPGNTNTLLFSLQEYSETLTRTQGGVPEFVNPKYADATKTVFKAPTRLECMMQDYPKLLGSGARVGFTSFDRWICFSAVKNSLAEAKAKQAAGLPPQSAGAGEVDFYLVNVKILQSLGVEVEEATDEIEFGGIKYVFPPRVVIEPSFAVSVSELRSKIQGSVKIGKNATVYLEGQQSQLPALTVNGTLRVTEAGLENKDGTVTFVPVEAGDADYLQIRAFKAINLAQ